MPDYPDNWQEIARKVKSRAGWRCRRCGHPHELPKERRPCDDLCDPDRHPGGLNDGRQRILTVHHLDGDKSNCRWWNLAALCQVCHLTIQCKVDMNQQYPFPHSTWFLPYVAGYYAHQYDLPDDRETITKHVYHLVALGQGRIDRKSVAQRIESHPQPDPIG